MKRFRWLKEHLESLELASHLLGRPRTRRPAVAGLRRSLRAPEPLEPRLLLATFLVTNTNNSGAGSLRAAIADANAAAGFDVINFLIAGSGPHVISPQRTNPADPLSVAMPISSPMLIDGYSQAGASPNMLSEGNDADIRIRLDGALAGAGAGGLFIDGGGATIRGLAITRFEDGVIIRGGGGGNTIAGNYIGLDPLGNPLGNLGHGVTIEGSPGNTVGGANPADRNVISANGRIGVRLVRSGSVDNVIRGNYIGTDPSGMVDRGNGGSLGPGGSGIEVGVFSIDQGYASRTIIGGTTPGAGNLISGNSGSGIVLLGTPSRDNVIQGNYIGTTVTGDDPLGNDRNGILLTLPLLQNGQPASGSASNNTIGGTEPGAGNVISGNKRSGIVLFGAAINNVIQGNFVGTNALGNGDVGNTLEGILLSDAADINVAGPSNTRIGGTTAGAGNVISGNDQNGVALLGAGTQFNELLGNRIGANATGTAAIANSLHGVTISLATGGGNAASNNFIGGVTPGARNIVSGNGQAGVALLGTGATGNVVQGNYIGTNMTGTAAIPNVNDGVRLGDAALGAGPSGNFIGGTLPGAGNLISGNTSNGIEIAGVTTSGNIIEGNLIGTNAAGNAAVRNSQSGVFIEGAPNTIIGGTTIPARNVISGNANFGVHLNLATATGNKIEGNYIGVAADGVAGVANLGSGVYVSGDASGNTIGGATTAAGNEIAYNGVDGVTIASGVRNTVRLNSIYDNDDLGIDLNFDADTLNDEDDSDTGPNDLQNWPEIVHLSFDGAVSRAKGFFEGKNNTTYKFDFYANDGDNISLLGEGQQYLSTETLTTDANGYVEFSFVIPFPIPLATPLGKFLTVTATDPDGNTSEFSHDADTDGLYDHWESGAGVDGNNDGMADFFLNNPNPLHKDIYVEVDAMGVIEPAAAGSSVSDAFFLNAPALSVLNPDGDIGINLHFELDPDPIFQTVVSTMEELRAIKDFEFGTDAEFDHDNAAAILAAKRMTHRYAVFAPGGVDHGGRSWLWGHEFYVSLGEGEDTSLAAAFMHELGHALKLGHGGGDGLNYKPNYHSIMNYNWSYPGGSTDPTAFRTAWELDYSDDKWPTLDENFLVEADGIGGHAGHLAKIGPLPAGFAPELGPVDWNGDGDNGMGGDIIATGLDINELFASTPGNPDPGEGITELHGHDDWSNLVLSFRHSDPYRKEFGLERIASGSGAGGDNEPEPDLPHEVIATLNDIGYTNKAVRVQGRPAVYANEGDTISFTVPAIDPEGDALTFALAPGAPPGAMIHPTTGQFTWPTDASDGYGEYVITVRVTDAGSLRTREQNYGFLVDVGLTGDYNLNGSVDAADYVVWRKTQGTTGPLYAGADSSGNGIIDQADYLMWRANFGKTLPPPASSSGAGAVALLPQRQDLAEVAARPAEPATSERVANEVRRPNVAIAHFDHRSSNITTARGIGARLTGADRSYLAARQDDALVAWLATLATNDPSNDADRLLEVDINRAAADFAEIGLTTIDLALETLGTASI